MRREIRAIQGTPNVVKPKSENHAALRLLEVPLGQRKSAYMQMGV
jgi:hypothetical protein